MGGVTPSGTIRGATATTRGSLKWASTGSSHPSPGTQSESMNATNGVPAWASPALRAAEGPTLTGRVITSAPASSAMARVRAGSDEASSTTRHRFASSVESSRRSCSGRSRTGITAVTSSGPNSGTPGRGRNAPALTRRRARTGSPFRSPTVAPACQRSIRALAREETRRRRRGLPPMMTRPPSSLVVPGSAVRPKVGGNGVDARSGAVPIGAGAACVFPAGGVHSSILAGWAPVLTRGRVVCLIGGAHAAV